LIYAAETRKKPAMQWYYSDQGQQRGPVSAEQLEKLTRSGVVTPRTLVWREGFANWMPYSAIAQRGLSPQSGAPVSNAAGGDLVVCTECRRGFPKSETVQFEGSYVCAGCKPIFMQKLREGVSAGAGIWRSGKQLVTCLDATLPPRCVKCNAPTDTRPVTRKLYWHPPAVYLALLLNIIIYAIIAMIARKRGLAVVSICQPHRSARRNVIIISWLLVLGGIAAGITGIAEESGWIGGLGAVALLGGVIYGIVRGRLIFARKIDKENMWLGGCGAEFLAEFPDWTGPR
jgi:hypothetical protein